MRARSTSSCGRRDGRRARGRSAPPQRRPTWSSGCSRLGLVDDDPARGRDGAHRAAGAGAAGGRGPASPDRRGALASERIAAIAFGGPIPTELKPREADPNNVEYLAYLDGEPCASVGVVLGVRRHALRRRDAAGGARPGRLPGARGRALGRRRCPRHAGARTQAAPMSRPILAQLGFEEVCEIQDPARRRSAHGQLACPGPSPADGGERQNGRVRVSAKADYAIRAGVELAAAGEGPLKGERIAQAQADPANFLENILADLRHAGLVTQPARRRGRLLARAAGRRRSRLADVIRAVDGPLANVRGIALGAGRVRRQCRAAP